MASIKLHHFNNYHFLIKPLALLILGVFLISCNKKEIQHAERIGNWVESAENAVNINTAPIAELEKLPNVGTKLAQKIVEHREKYGTFRKPEHLILVQGISDHRFRQLQDLIKTE